MNQYIITEEELGGIIDITEDMCIQEGWVKEVVPLAQERMSIINRVRSHPYQSERDTYKKLAELFFEWLDNIDTASDIAKGDDKLYRSFVSQEHKKRFEYANPDGSLKELRQAGEP